MNSVFPAIVLMALLAPCIGLAGGSPARTGPFVPMTLDDLNDTALANVPPDAIACLGRRRTYGEVIARWEPHEFLIRTRRRHMDATNMVMRIDAVSGTLPVPGQIVEVTGFPETDLYRINLTRARWRPSNTPPFPPESAVRLTARDIVVGKDRARGFDYTLHGHLVRMTGKVLSLPSGLSSDRFLSLDNGGITVNVDVSALAGGAEDAQIGATAEVTGVCVFDIDNWRPNAAFPQIKGFRIVPRTAEDLRVIAAAPWWTPARFWSVIGSLAALLVAIFAWNLSLRRLAERRGRQLAAESVAHAESDLKNLERTRLAVELHDSISQNLSGASLQIDAARNLLTSAPALASTSLDVAARTLVSCRAELRNCIWDLRNNALDVPDLNEAIRRTIQRLVGGATLKIRFNIPREALSDNTVHALMRIVRELATNAVRHGAAKTIRIAGALEDGILRFSVTDDGRGFDPENRPGLAEGHFGLQGIRERVKQFDGSFALERLSPKGMKATISIKTAAIK